MSHWPWALGILRLPNHCLFLLIRSSKHDTFPHSPSQQASSLILCKSLCCKDFRPDFKRLLFTFKMHSWFFNNVQMVLNYATYISWFRPSNAKCEAIIEISISLVVGDSDVGWNIWTWSWGKFIWETAERKLPWEVARDDKFPRITPPPPKLWHPQLSKELIFFFCIICTITVKHTNNQPSY